MIRIMTALALAGLVLGACDDGPTTPADSGTVEVRFSTDASVNTGATLASDLIVEGTNGTLEITSLHMIVGEFELEGADDACLDDDSNEADLEDCEEFEGNPFLLDLPLDGQPTTEVVQAVTAGTYNELEFEVDDVDLDDGDGDDEELADVTAQVRALHADWPDEASMVVEGTFTPTDGETRAFRVFIEAEVEVEITLSPPLLVTDDGEVSLTVVLDPMLWFTRSNGTVLDLSLFDYTGNGDDLLELEVEFEDGVTRVEVDND